MTLIKLLLLLSLTCVLCSVKGQEPRTDDVEINCRVYNWDKLVCLWRPALANRTEVLYYSTQSKFYKCPHMNFTKENCASPKQNNFRNETCGVCTWGKNVEKRRDKFKADFTYCVYVDRKNHAGKTQKLKIKTADIVQPNPVQEIKAKNISSTKVNVTWIEHSYRALKFSIEYTAEGYNTSQIQHHIEKADNTRDHFEETLENLHPYTKYTIQIRCHPQRREGFWSEPSVTTITTNQDVPAASPEIVGFVLKSASLENKHKVMVIWQSVPKLLQHGEIRQVRINITDTNREIQTYTVSGSPRSYTMDVDATESYDVTVEVSTVGFNNSLVPRPYQIPRKKEMPPHPEEFRVISDRAGTITAYWNNKDVDQISLFWCKGVYSMEECHGELSKKTVSSGDQNVTVVQLEDYDQYIFGAAMEWVTEHQVKSGGIHWGDCTFQKEEDPAQPLNAKYSSYQVAGSLTIEWDKPECKKYGYTENYYITYCLVSECNEKSVSKRKLKIPGSLNKYTISSLEALKEYEVTLYAESPFGKRSKEVHLGHIKVVQKGLTGINITILCVGAIVVILLVVLGARCIYRSAKRRVKKFLKPEVEMPPPVELPEQSDYWADHPDINRFSYNTNRSQEQLPLVEFRPTPKITSDIESGDPQDDTSLEQKPENPQELSDTVSSQAGINGVEVVSYMSREAKFSQDGQKVSGPRYDNYLYCKLGMDGMFDDSYGGGCHDSGVQVSRADCDPVSDDTTYKPNYRAQISEDGAYSSLPCSESSVSPYTQYTSELEDNDSQTESLNLSDMGSDANCDDFDQLFHPVSVEEAHRYVTYRGDTCQWEEAPGPGSPDSGVVSPTYFNMIDNRSGRIQPDAKNSHTENQH